MTDVANGQGPFAEPVRGDYAPGAGFYSATAVLVFAILFLSALASFPALMLGILLCVGLVGMAIGWLVLAVITAIRTRLRIGGRDWVRWLGFPAIAVLCLGLLGTSAPFRLRFELSRAAFQEAADRAEAGKPVAGGDFGLFHVDYVTKLANGVWFEDLSLGFIDPCGLAYTSTGVPDIRILTTDLGGGWWLACQDF